MSKRLTLVFYTLLGTLGAALFVMTLIASFFNAGIWKSVWTTVIFLSLTAALVISVIVYVPQKSIYSIGFYLMHAGLAFFITGMLIFTFLGHSVVVSAPSLSSVSGSAISHVDSGYYNRIPGKNGEAADLGFNFRVADFVTEYHDEDKTEVKHYEAVLEFFDNGNESRTPLTVNHPLYKNGWKIYLLSVSKNEIYGYDEISLMFKRDPGEILSTTGIILSIIGVFAICLPQKRKAVRDK